MVPGFNHNVKRRGRSYHAQTEDLGVDNPFIVTHLFSGGNVVASLRTSYAEVVEVDDLPGRVRELMEEQHKRILRNLVAGNYDGETGAARSEVRDDRAPRPSQPPPAQAAHRAAERHRPLPLPPLAPDPSIDQNLEQVLLAYLAGEPDACER
jgi:hypothetical protein